MKRTRRERAALKDQRLGEAATVVNAARDPRPLRTPWDGHHPIEDPGLRPRCETEGCTNVATHYAFRPDAANRKPIFMFRCEACKTGLAAYRALAQ